MAVALGVGAAVASGNGLGLAYADDTAGVNDSAAVDAPSETTTDPEGPVPTESDDPPADDDSETTADGPEMNLGNSGGVDTSVNDAGQSTDTTADEDDDETAEAPEPPADNDPPEEPEPPTRQRESTPPATQTVGANLERRSADEPAEPPAPVESEPEPVQSFVADTIATTASLSVDEPAATQSVVSLPGTLARIATSFVDALLRPFLGPSAPAEPPLLWAVLAWVRREVNRTFFSTNPDAVADLVTTSEDTPTTVDVLGNDVDDDPLRITAITQAANGTVVLNADGTVTYTPNENFSGTDTFTYTVREAHNPFHLHGLASFFGGARHTDTAAVIVTVGGINDAPVARDNIAGVVAGGTTTITVTDNDSDVDGTIDVTTVTIVGDPAYGTATVDPVTGVITYTSNGEVVRDTFTYTVKDNLGATSNVATVAVIVTPDDSIPDDTLDPDELQDLVDRGVVVAHLQDGAVHAISGDFAAGPVHNAADAAAELNRVAALLGAATGFAAEDDISVFTVNATQALHYYRLRPTVDGVPVAGSEVVVIADGTGKVRGLMSSYDNRIAEIDTTPAAGVDTTAEAVAAAGSALLAALGDDVAPDDADAFLATLTFEPELVIDDLDADREPRLVWRVAVFTTPVVPDLEADEIPETPPSVFPVVSATYVIAANGPDAGTVLDAEADWDSAGAAVFHSAADLDGVMRGLVVVKQGNNYRLYDGSRLISVYRNSVYGPKQLFTQAPPGTIVTSDGSFIRPDAVSALANMAEIYDYFRDTLHYESVDGIGDTPIRVTLIPDYDDAQWNRNYQQFFFGTDGDWAAAVDVFGHEYIHGIVQNILGRDALKSGEAASVNEAFADILGNLAQRGTGSEKWLFGEDLANGAIRNMADPSSLTWTDSGIEYREDYDERYRGSSNQGGVHINSTILSHAAYLMMNDGATTGVSDEAWSRIFFSAIPMLVSGSKSPMVDARIAVVMQAEIEGLSQVQVDAVKEAFNKVDINNPYDPGPDFLKGGVSIPDAMTSQTVLNAEGTRAIVTSTIIDPGANVYPTAITFFDTTTGKQIGERMVFAAGAYAEFNPIGTRAVIASNVDDPSTPLSDAVEIQVYDTRTFERVGSTVEVAASYGENFEFDASGRRMVFTTFNDGATQLHLIDVETGTRVGDAVVVGGGWRVTPGFNADGSRYTVLTEGGVLSGQTVTRVVVLDTATGRQVGSAVELAGRSLAYVAADGRRILVVGSEYNPDATHAAVIDTMTGAVVGTEIDLPGVVSGVAGLEPTLTANGRALITTVIDGGTPEMTTRVTVVDIDTGSQVSSVSQAGDVGQAVISPDGTRIVFVRRDLAEVPTTSVSVINAVTGAQIGTTFVGPVGAEVGVVPNVAGTRLLLMVVEGEGFSTTTRLMAMDTVTGLRIGQTVTLEGQMPRERGASMSFDGNRVVVLTGSPFTGTRAAVFDLMTGTQVGSTVVYPGTSNPVGVLMAPDGKRATVTQQLLNGSEYITRVSTIDTTTGALIGTPVVLSGFATVPVQLTSDGKRAVVTAPSTTYNFSTGGYRILTSTAVIDLATGRQIGSTVTVNGQPYTAGLGERAVYLTADGTRGLLATYNYVAPGYPTNVRVTVIDTVTGRQVGNTAIFEGGLDGVPQIDITGTRATFTADIFNLVTFDRSSQVFGIDLTTGKPIGASPM
ncbi:hypothetical protein BHQ18_09485 [Mycolicibacterium flavescens]|uniref:Tandem-95 repeat protein n=1 Tax=Mycolicibacterium flavescens TaxID=1776 RepID=A0A1E3RM50_MYCFV|nr:hypothetical protein BHQ18_09485 [Mycolicibacterium flavescens]